jgi:hypothetical protein
MNKQASLIDNGMDADCEAFMMSPDYLIGL